MRALAVSLLLLSLSAASAAADPVVFKPDGCDFEIAFPSTPTQSQTKNSTDRGDTIVTSKADLHLDAGGKTNILRAECSKIPHMGFMDESILSANMHDLADAYKMANPNVAVLRNQVAGSVGRLHARARSGGKDITLEIYRYTSGSSIFDVWIGAEPDAFPTEAETAFLKSIKLNGQAVP
jgi:hypothetical protein